MNKKLASTVFFGSAIFLGVSAYNHYLDQRKAREYQRQINKNYLFDMAAIARTAKTIEAMRLDGKLQGKMSYEIEKMFYDELEFQKIAVRNI